MKSNSIKELIKLIKEEQSNKSVLEELQPVTNNNYTSDTEIVNGPTVDPSDDELIEDEEYLVDDPNLLMDPMLNLGASTIEQKKVMLIEYFSKVINKVVIMRDHIDTLSFDSVVTGNSVIGVSQLQFNLEELKEKVSKYIEDQFETDKYERALYVYLSFMEELKLIIKLIQRQTKKL